MLAFHLEAEGRRYAQEIDERAAHESRRKEVLCNVEE
jgi:hypothetical protein